MINPWQPHKDPHDLALLAKLAEEATELAKACTRAIMQGLDGIDPDNDLSNVENIEREYVDIVSVYQTMVDRNLVAGYNNMDPSLRQLSKMAGFHQWMALIKKD